MTGIQRQENEVTLGSNSKESGKGFKLKVGQRLGSKATHCALWSPRHIQQLPAPGASQLHRPKGQIQEIWRRQHYRRKVRGQRSRVTPLTLVGSTPSPSPSRSVSIILEPKQPQGTPDVQRKAVR